MSEVETTVWHPASFLARTRGKNDQAQFALLILNQPIERPAIFNRLWKNALYKVVADGGANQLFDACGARAQHYLPDRIHGDLDSIRPDVEVAYKQWGVCVSKDPDQYSTDLGKCLGKADRFGHDQKLPSLDVVILGGLGGRVDQGFSLMHQLFKTSKETSEDHGKLVLISSENVSFVIPAGRNEIHTPLDDLAENIGIIPLDGPAVISTKGLEWDVTEWRTDFGGQVSTSNHIKASKIEIITDRPVLFTVEISKNLQVEELEF